MKMQFAPFQGMILCFDPTKGDMELAKLVLAFIRDNACDDEDQAAVRQFISLVHHEDSTIQ